MEAAGCAGAADSPTELSACERTSLVEAVSTLEVCVVPTWTSMTLEYDNTLVY